MKSSYNLLSIHLDQKPIPKQELQFIHLNDVKEIWDISDNYNLFDYPICNRKISGQKLLSANSLEDITTLVNKLVNCNIITIVLDYWSISTVAIKLYAKRVLQMVALLLQNYPAIKFQLAGDDSKWHQVLKTIYLEAKSF